MRFHALKIRRLDVYRPEARVWNSSSSGNDEFTITHAWVFIFYLLQHCLFFLMKLPVQVSDYRSVHFKNKSLWSFYSTICIETNVEVNKHRSFLNSGNQSILVKLGGRIGENVELPRPECFRLNASWALPQCAFVCP